MGYDASSGTPAAPSAALKLLLWHAQWFIMTLGLFSLYLAPTPVFPPLITLAPSPPMPMCPLCSTTSSRWWRWSYAKGVFTSKY
jgi:hypothetical protein